MQRRVVTVRGIVQGVGFRPFVYGLASQLDLGGFVRNRGGEVAIEVEGEPAALNAFVEELTQHPPPLARIDSVSWAPLPTQGDRAFHIEASHADVAAQVVISPDIATCPDCLRELFDPQDRRYGYPFLNCTNCGPRLTIVTGAPYDRERTTLADFTLCPQCRAEYDDPRDRRFHAQPVACPACGPQLEARDATGRPLKTDDPLAVFVAALRDGRIGALKGLGGFHLVCDARRNDVVQELRRRKHRDEKPLAVMVRDLPAAEALCAVDPLARQLLASPRCPIVLLHLPSAASGPIAEAVAPGNPYLGVMLPYTPLHHLLLAALDGAPLVMTSGNRSDEPIAYENEDALQRLAGIADVFLIHNRPIHVRCDDSVARVVAGAELPLRRSRGYAPQPMHLPRPCPAPVLAVGGQLKGTFALARGEQVFLSHHLGDLDHYEAFRAFEKDVTLYEALFAIPPEWIAHDLHPDYASTRYALARGLPCIAVQHHHAHLAACLAEHGLNERAIGVTFDGTGLGTDGAVWGGEFLVGDYASFQRAARLRYVGMPGGEQAIREPWRMAIAHLRDAGCASAGLSSRIPAAALRTVETMLDRGFNAPPTSSMGRLFDAVAAIAGLRTHASHEGQAAIELEWAAVAKAPDTAYPWEVLEQSEDASGQPSADPSGVVIDTRPLIRAVADDARGGVEPARIARRFHSTIVEVIVGMCVHIRQKTGLEATALSGGVWMNALLTEETTARLTREGFRVYRHQHTPPNDGGLSLGQAAVAAHRITCELERKTPDSCALESPAESSKPAARTTC